MWDFFLKTVHSVKLYQTISYSKILKANNVYNLYSYHVKSMSQSPVSMDFSFLRTPGIGPLALILLLTRLSLPNVKQKYNTIIFPLSYQSIQPFFDFLETDRKSYPTYIYKNT
jgi:hypothetical protein